MLNKYVKSNLISIKNRLLPIRGVNNGVKRDFSELEEELMNQILNNLFLQLELF